MMHEMDAKKWSDLFTDVVLAEARHSNCTLCWKVNAGIPELEVNSLK